MGSLHYLKPCEGLRSSQGFLNSKFLQQLYFLFPALHLPIQPGGAELVEDFGIERSWFQAALFQIVSV